MKTKASILREIAGKKMHLLHTITLIVFSILFQQVQAQNRQLIFKSENHELTQNLIKLVQGEYVLPTVENIEIATLLKKYNIHSVQKLYPSSRRINLQKYYMVNAEKSNHFLAELTNKFPGIIKFTREYQAPISLYNPNDFRFMQKTSEDSNRYVGLSYLELINATQAWDITKGDEQVIIGIYDSHLYVDHEDLKGKIACVYDKNDRSDYVINPDHGTMVAGLIAANTDNNKGIASVAFNCKLAKTSFNKNDLLKMAQNGVKVINISQDWGPYNSEHQELINELVQDYHVTVVASAGNKNDTAYVYPASYDNVISVTSVGHEFNRGTTVKGKKANWKDCHKKYQDEGYESFTHQHNNKVDICAPGYNILTLCNPATFKNYYGNPSGQIYTVQSGSSFASAIVSGVVGLMYSANPALVPYEIEQIIKSTAVDIYSIPENAEFKGLLGAGRIDAYAAVKLAKDYHNPSNQLVNSDFNEIDNEILVYPNPATGPVHIKGAKTNDFVQVYSSTGNLLINHLAQGKTESLSFSEFLPGIYFIQVIRNNKILKHEKIVKI